MSAALKLEPQQISPEAATRQLWKRGRLAHKLRPEQLILKLDLERAAVQLVVFNISRRWGKTYTLVVYCLEQCLRSRQKIRYGCAFLSDLEEFVLPAFNQILEDCPADLRPRYLSSKKTWYFPSTKSEIKLVGLDKNPNGLRGNAISIIIIDEAGFVKNLRRVYINVIVPATMKQKGIKVVFISTPPEELDHYFVALITKAITQPNGFYKTLTIDDISDLDPDERRRILDEVGGEDSNEAQREFFCKLIVDNELLAVPEQPEVEEFGLPEHFFAWVGGDTGGVRDRTHYLLMAYDFKRGKVLVVDERSFDRRTSSDIVVGEVKDMEAAFAKDKKVPRFVDAPGQLQLDMMGLYDFSTVLPRKDAFETSINFVRMEMPKIVVHPRCKMLLLTLERARLNKQRTDFQRSETTGHGDAIMALVYGLRHANRSNPFPAWGGADPMTHHIPYDKKIQQSQTASVLKSLFAVR